MERRKVLGFSEDTERRVGECTARIGRREVHSNDCDVADPSAWIIIDRR